MKLADHTASTQQGNSVAESHLQLTVDKEEQDLSPEASVCQPEVT